jgi:hypothetical protein
MRLTLLHCDANSVLILSDPFLCFSLGRKALMFTALEANDRLFRLAPVPARTVNIDKLVAPAISAATPALPFFIYTRSTYAYSNGIELRSFASRHVGDAAAAALVSVVLITLVPIQASCVKMNRTVGIWGGQHVSSLVRLDGGVDSSYSLVTALSVV